MPLLLSADFPESQALSSVPAGHLPHTAYGYFLCKSLPKMQVPAPCLLFLYTQVLPAGFGYKQPLHRRFRRRLSRNPRLPYQTAPVGFLRQTAVPDLHFSKAPFLPPLLLLTAECVLHIPSPFFRPHLSAGTADKMLLSIYPSLFPPVIDLC